MRLEHFDHRLSVAGLLVDGLVKQNHTADVLAEVLAAGEQQLTVRASVLLDVFNVDLRQTLADGC